ncbi:MAG: GNAT family N-acetyltransferase [Nocardioidaceae bacterium]
MLQRCCWVTEAQQNNALNIPPLMETLRDARAALDQWHTYVVRADGRLVASVRGRRDDDRWLIGRLMVAPDLQGRGIGRWLLEYVESVAPPETTSFELFTGSASLDNQRLYRRAGYRRDARRDDSQGVVVMIKPRGGLPRSI